MQDYILTYTSGNEADISDAFPDPTFRAPQRPRIEGVALPVRLAERVLFRAPYLEQFSDDHLAAMAGAEMTKRHLDSHHGHSRLNGNCIHYSCGPGGRKCMHGCTHHHNRAYVQFKRSGEMVFHCHSKKCPKPLVLGFWARSLDELLYADVWGPSGKVDGRLLDRVYKLASDECPGRSLGQRQQNIPDQDWFTTFENTVAAYMSHFYVFIKEMSMFIERRVGVDGQMLDFRTFSRKGLADHVKPYEWAFRMWEMSTYRLEQATLSKFVAEPFESDVPEGPFNLAANAMPLLNLPHLEPTTDEKQAIQPLLDHIKNSLLSGDQQDYESFMGWLAHVVKHPNKKIGW